MAAEFDVEKLASSIIETDAGDSEFSGWGVMGRQRTQFPHLQSQA